MVIEEARRRYDELIDSYLEYKPIFISLFSRKGDRDLYGILNELRALNDHIARCYIEGATDDQIYGEVCKAEGHLKRLIYDSFKQLNIIFYDYVNNFERKHAGLHWILVDNGTFWDDYTNKRLEITQSIESAKINESINAQKAYEYYQKAYELQEEIYQLLESKQNLLVKSLLKKIADAVVSYWGWFLSTVALSVIPMIIWESWRHWGNICDFFSQLFHNATQSIGQFF